MILQPFFKTIDTLSKNAGSKNGNIEAATNSIDSALIGMSGWIGKGNWKDSFGDIFRCFRDSMQRYYLRLASQTARQARANSSITPLRTIENALHVHVREPRRADKAAPPDLQPLDNKMQTVNEFDIVDVNDYMSNMSGI